MFYMESGYYHIPLPNLGFFLLLFCSSSLVGFKLKPLSWVGVKIPFQFFNQELCHLASSPDMYGSEVIQRFRQSLYAEFEVPTLRISSFQDSS